MSTQPDQSSSVTPDPRQPVPEGGEIETRPFYWPQSVSNLQRRYRMNYWNASKLHDDLMAHFATGSERSGVDTPDNAIYALFIVREFLDKLDAELERQQPTPTAIRLSAQQVIAAVRDFTKAMEQAIPEPQDSCHEPAADSRAQRKDSSSVQEGAVEAAEIVREIAARYTITVNQMASVLETPGYEPNETQLKAFHSIRAKRDALLTCAVAAVRQSSPRSQPVTATEEAVSLERNPVRLNVSREWCERMAKLEEGHEIGAGSLSEFPSAQPVTAKTALHEAAKWAAEVLSGHVDMCSPDCTCKDCPQCGKDPHDCTGTDCSRTCQCSYCDHCEAEGAINAIASALQSAQPVTSASIEDWMVRRLEVLQAQYRADANNHQLGSFRQSEALAFAVSLEHALITAVRQESTS